MSNKDYYLDPLLPSCLKRLPSDWNHVFEWVCENIRKLPPAWWQRASIVYCDKFNFVGACIPIKERNQRLWAANRWLRMQVEIYASGNKTKQLKKV